MDGRVEIAVADQIHIGARRLVLVLHRDFIVDLQAIHELLPQLLKANVVRDPNRDEIALEGYLHFQCAAARAGDLRQRAGLSVHRGRHAVALRYRRLGALVRVTVVRRVDLGLRGLAGSAAGGLMRGVVRPTGEPRIFSKRAGVDLEVACTRSKQFPDQLTTRDVRRHAKQFPNILVQVLAAAVGDRIGNVGNGAGHEGQGPWLASVPGLFFKLRQERDLKVIKVMIVSGELPAATVLHLRLDDVPVFIVVEAVARNGRGDRGHQGLVVAVHRLVRHMLCERTLAGIAMMVALTGRVSTAIPGIPNGVGRESVATHIGIAVLA